MVGESDDEQRHSYLKAAGVRALIVRGQDYQQVTRFDCSTNTADDLVLDIPTNIIGDFDDETRGHWEALDQADGPP